MEITNKRKLSGRVKGLNPWPVLWKYCSKVYILRICVGIVYDIFLNQKKSRAFFGFGGLMLVMVASFSDLESRKSYLAIRLALSETSISSLRIDWVIVTGINGVTSLCKLQWCELVPIQLGNRTGLDWTVQGQSPRNRIGSWVRNLGTCQSGKWSRPVRLLV